MCLVKANQTRPQAAANKQEHQTKIDISLQKRSNKFIEPHRCCRTIWALVFAHKSGTIANSHIQWFFFYSINTNEIDKSQNLVAISHNTHSDVFYFVVESTVVLNFVELVLAL